jgi:hypothetical protein
VKCTFGRNPTSASVTLKLFLSFEISIMATFVGESLQVLAGNTTAWLPISTPWSSVAACSTRIYQQEGGGSMSFIAFDPLFGSIIAPTAVPCLPAQVTASWFQSNPDTTTVLGPTFVCPGAYSAVLTLLQSTSTQQILCCPS